MIIGARLSQISRRYVGLLGERDARLLDLRMPALLPFEAVEPAIADLHERRNLPLHRHLACSGEDVAAVVAGGDGIFEMRVPDVASQLAHGVLWLLLARHEGVMRVPQQRDVG